MGITMVELLVGMLIVTMLSGLSVSGWSRYQKTVEHKGAAQEIVSTLRNAQQRSLAEAVTYCVSFDVPNRSYQLSKFGCGSAGIPIGSAKKTQSNRVELRAPTFQQSSGGTASTVLFYPRGSATKGSVVVARSGSSKAYTITVEGLTGRVSLNG